MSGFVGFDWDVDTGDVDEPRKSTLTFENDGQRNLWTQADQDRLDDGPHYPHTPGPPSERAEHAKTESAEAARQSIAEYGRQKQADRVKVHYDRARRDYMPDEVSGNQERFTLTEPAHKITRAELPTSPRKYLDAALAIGWEANAWLNVGEMAPELYVNDSDNDDESASEHAAGDVKFDGYTLRIFTIEAADKARKLGFRATFLGRVYEDGRKAPVGSFDNAMLADPAGIPIRMRYEYQPVKVTRGKDAKGRTVETPAGFAKRQREAQAMADRLTRTTDDGTVWWKTRHMVTTAAELNAWIAEWASFARVRSNA